jgi:hypothetical protein
MARHRRDEEIVISLLKQFARDKKCPIILRVYCTTVLAVITKMIEEKNLATIPGVPRYNRSLSVPEVELPEAEMPEPQEVVSDFVSSLGGARGNS